MVSQISSGSYDVSSLWQTLFKNLDTNGDNALNSSELSSVAANLGTSADGIIVTLDSDQNGVVGKSEFESALSKLRAQQPPGPPPQVMGSTSQDMFSTIDQNGDESISTDELSSFMTQENSGLSTSDVSSLFSGMDSDSDGSITESELESYMQAMAPPPPPPPDMLSSESTDSMTDSTSASSTADSTNTSSTTDSTNSDLNWESKLFEALLNAYNKNSDRAAEANSIYAYA